MELTDVLARTPQLRLCRGVVAMVVGNFCHITYSGGRVDYVSKFDGQTYAVGDVVAFLLDDTTGGIILGKQAPGTPPPLPPAPAAPLALLPTGAGTYDTISATWTPTVLTQSPTTIAAWSYSAAALAPLAGMNLASFEIEVNRTSGGPPEFVGHLNPTLVGPLTTAGDPYVASQTPAAVSTWVALPIEWGQQLASGTIKGIAIGGGLFSGTYSGTGRVRLTPA